MEAETLLVEYFIDRYARKDRKNIRGVNKKTLQLLQSYPWPGNIRELQNVIERAVIRSRNGPLDVGLLPAGNTAARAPRKSDSAAKSAPTSLHDLKQRERAFILEALAKTGGKIYGPDGAAALLGLKPTTLSSKVHRMGLKKFLA